MHEPIAQRQHRAGRRLVGLAACVLAGAVLFGQPANAAAEDLTLVGGTDVQYVSVNGMWAMHDDYRGAFVGSVGQWRDAACTAQKVVGTAETVIGIAGFPGDAKKISAIAEAIAGARLSGERLRRVVQRSQRVPRIKAQRGPLSVRYQFIDGHMRRSYQWGRGKHRVVLADEGGIKDDLLNAGAKLLTILQAGSKDIGEFIQKGTPVCDIQQRLAHAAATTEATALNMAFSGRVAYRKTEWYYAGVNGLGQQMCERREYLQTFSQIQPRPHVTNKPIFVVRYADGRIGKTDTDCFHHVLGVDEPFVENPVPDETERQAGGEPVRQIPNPAKAAGAVYGPLHTAAFPAGTQVNVYARSKTLHNCRGPRHCGVVVGLRLRDGTGAIVAEGYCDAGRKKLCMIGGTSAASSPNPWSAEVILNKRVRPVKYWVIPPFTVVIREAAASAAAGEPEIPYLHCPIGRQDRPC